MSFVNQYRSTTIYGELKVQKYNTGNINGLLDISGNSILRGDVGVYGNLYASDGTVDISGNLAVSGNITGTVANATNATNIAIATDATNASFYPTFVSTTTGNLPAKVDSDLTYNPSTNTLTCTNITGTCSNATDAVNANNVAVVLTGTALKYISMVGATNGNRAIQVDTSFNYDPTTTTLTVPSISGSCNKIYVTGSTTSGDQRVPFIVNDTGDTAIRSNFYFTYNPSTTTLTVPNIAGLCSNATNSVNADLAAQVTVSTVSTGIRNIAMFAGSGTRTCLIDTDLTYDAATNTLTCTNITGTCSNATNATNSTNATNISIAADATNATFYPTFVSTTTGNLPAKVDSDLTYNPSTNTLTCTNITGTCSNATNATNSTNATNISIAADATNASFYPTFVSTTTGNLPLKVDGGITYNPSTNLLTTTVSSVNVTAVSTDADYRVPFLATTTGSSTVSSDGGITYNPSLNALNVSRINSGYVGGVILIDGTNTGSLNYYVTLNKSASNLADLYNQSSLTPVSATLSGAATGSLVTTVNVNDLADRILIFPNWGIKGYQNSNYSTLLIDIGNNNDFPIWAEITNNVMTSCRIYLNGVEQT